MGILSGGGGSANFDRLLESATSQLQLEPNWANILEICDSIRQKDVTAKYAVTAIRRRMKDPNPHVAKFALVTLEACMKNCGEPMHDEVASREFMDELRVILKSGSDPVKEQILSMVQTWNQTLGKKSTYRIIQDTYNLLKAEGYAFPQLNESDAMYLAETAPEWAEGDNCHQCRVKFTTFTRQHHCRCCGQVFCAKCSAKNSIIPKYGIEREVRVCDACYDSINPSGPEKPGTSSKDTQSLDTDDLPAEYLNSSLAKEAQTKPKASDADIKAQEEEEFQLAMALSLSAAETEQQQAPKRNFASTAAPETPYSSPSSASLYSELKSNLYTDVVTDSKKASNSSDGGELSHYLNRDYWEKRKDGRSAEPSAPVVHEVEEVVARGAPAYASVEEEDHDDDGQNSDAFVKTFSNSIEMFINRIQTVKSKGKHIAMDSTVQNLFQSLSAMHPQLMTLIEDEEDNKAKYEAMLQKVALVREARESLDSMRNQHREKLNHQELEQEMLRRMQMEQKLELMRQQKQEYLEYQRQLQIQRQQEIEQQQQYKLQQKQFLLQDRNSPQYGYEAGADVYGIAYPIPVDQPAQPAHMMQYQKQQQQQQQQGKYAEQQQPGYGPRSEPMAQEPTMQGQQMVQRQATQPQGGQTGYIAQGQMQATMPQQPQQAPYSEAQPQPPGAVYQPSQQQPVQYPTKAPDLLDTPIGEDLGQQQREAQSQGYNNQPFQQQSVKYRQNQEQQISQQHQQQQRVSPQQQHYQPQQQQNQAPMSYQVQAQQPSSTQQQPASMQQQPGRMHQQPGSVQQQPGNMQQQPGSMHQQPASLQQQPGRMQQQPGGMQHQPGSMQQQPGGMQQQPGSMQQQAGRIQQQAGNMQQQPYPNAAISTAQTTTHPSYPNQPQLQSYPESSTYGQQQQLPGNVSNQYSNQQLTRSQPGPASLPYDGQPRNQGVPGPASLPASLSQYPGGHQGYAGDPGYPQNPQQTAYIQQQQTRTQDQHITEAMKDLQLISFE